MSNHFLLCSCSRSSFSTRRRWRLRRHQLPGAGAGSMPCSHPPPAPNRQRGPAMSMLWMRMPWSYTSGSAWRRSTGHGPRSSPPLMYAPRSSVQPLSVDLVPFPSLCELLISEFSHPVICFVWILVDCHQEVLRGINLKLFDQVLHWVQESFSAIRAIAKPRHTEIQQPFPLLADVICRRIPAAFVLTSEHLLSNVQLTIVSNAEDLYR